METLKKRLEEQTTAASGRQQMDRTAGTSPFGAYGFNPEGGRVGQDGGRNRSAVKVWDKREFRQFWTTRSNSARATSRWALRRLRRFARRGAPMNWRWRTPIDATARAGGCWTSRCRRSGNNVVKVLLLLDIGGSMDDHVKTCEELFSAARKRVQASRALLFPQFHV